MVVSHTPTSSIKQLSPPHGHGSHIKFCPSVCLSRAKEFKPKLEPFATRDRQEIEGRLVNRVNESAVSRLAQKTPP